MKIFLSIFLFVTVSGCTGGDITKSETGISFELRNAALYMGELSRVGKKAEEHCAGYGKKAEMIEKAETFVRFACVEKQQ